jgi:hypothetical protein
MRSFRPNASINFVSLMVFYATFSNISVISLRSVLLVEETGGPGKKTTDLSQVTDKLYLIMLYWVHLAWFELTYDQDHDGLWILRTEPMFNLEHVDLIRDNWDILIVSLMIITRPYLRGTIRKSCQPMLKLPTNYGFYELFLK